MKTVDLRSSPLLLLLLGGAAACAPAPAPPGEPAAVLRAPLAIAERASAPGSVELAGSVEAERTTAVASRVVALVTRVHVGLGDRVVAGQELVTIDATAARGQLAQAEGALAQAAAALALAERNHERFRALAATGSASELELDAARAQHEQARGAVEQAQGAVASARSLAAEARVVAPYAGRVASRTVEAGDLAAPGRPLMSIESDRGRRLVVSVPERLAVAAALAPGARVPVSLDARPGADRLAGTVAELSAGPDPVTHAYTVKIELGDLDVPAGAAGRAWLPTAARSAVTVPADAIVEQGGLDLVVVRGDDGRARTRVVTLGEPGADGRIEVLSGLAGGERVALGLLSAPPAGARLEDAGVAP